MASIRLYLDEDVHLLLADVLRRRGFDVLSVHEAQTRGQTDEQQFARAIQDGRAILTFNACDYVPLATRAASNGTTFAGLVVSDQLSFRELLRRTLRLLNVRSAEDIANTIVWPSAYR